VIVHSAGVEAGSTVENTEAATWQHVFDVNVFAVAELTRHALPALRAASGLVVSINSGSGFTSSPGGGTYAASKFALRAMTDALREEERPGGVRVSSIHPGRTDTGMQRQLVASEGDEYDTRFYLTPDDVASAVRMVVDLPPAGTVEMVSVRPTRNR
jgi:NADP-dependent 3-hydroxy acid dehydrogenase YdfG